MSDNPWNLSYVNHPPVSARGRPEAVARELCATAIDKLFTYPLPAKYSAGGD
ncbi:hypothetical protein V2L05_08505 [Pseudomonas alliivorans]|nr:hypothetical protein [Pseudomonas alliivorans]MEE5126567.1 hypothetical protein [Pseudomonas alliivorans]MEE5162675.1 hypothetical protein [Pseudomonas alliivorans]